MLLHRRVKEEDQWASRLQERTDTLDAWLRAQGCVFPCVPWWTRSCIKDSFTPWGGATKFAYCQYLCLTLVSDWVVGTGA